MGSDDSCKIIVTYPATAELTHPVHFMQTNQKIPELWVAQSAVSNYKPPYAPVQLPNGRDFRFMDALNMGIMMQGGTPALQEVQYAPGALVPAGPMKNSEMSVRNGNLVWEYTIPTPENYSSTIIRVTFACPWDTSKNCEASTDPVLFPLTQPFGTNTCWASGNDENCKNTQMMLR